METLYLENATTFKKFLLVETSTSEHKVVTIKVTDDEIRNDVLRENFGINYERYDLLTASEYIGDRNITDVEIGEVLEIDRGMLLIRLA